MPGLPSKKVLIFFIFKEQIKHLFFQNVGKVMKTNTTSADVLPGSTFLVSVTGATTSATICAASVTRVLLLVATGVVGFVKWV